jgi:Bacterial Ig domain
MKIKSFVLGAVMVLSVLVVLVGCTEKINESENEVVGIELTNPGEGALLDGIVILRAEVMERSGIRQVEFFVDGDPLGVDMESPYEVEWNTETAVNDIHSLECRGILENSDEVMADTLLVTVRNLLFTANYIDYFEDDATGYIYVSDQEGNILGEAGWTANGTIEVEHSPDNGLIPDRVSVTMVHNFSELGTFFAIPKGSVWTYEGDDSPMESHPVELYFKNVPENEGFLLSNLWQGMSTNSILGESQLLYFPENPSDLYIRLKTEEFGNKYKWVYDVTEDSCEVDLAEMSYPDSTIIELDYVPDEFSYVLYGYPEPESHKIGYYLDFNLFVPGTNTFTFIYPPDDFTDYGTRITFDDNEDHNTHFSQTIYGAIPEAISRYDVEYDLISNEPDDFQMQVTGDCNCVRVQWRYGEKYIHWNVYGPPDNIDFTFPTPPVTVFENMPDLDMGSMELNSLTFYDYSPLDSYDEVIYLKYKSDEYIFDALDSYRVRWIGFDTDYKIRNRQIDEDKFDIFLNDWEDDFLGSTLH